jgi:rod shape-determining protein MreD
MDVVKIAPFLLLLAVVQVAVLPQLSPYAGTADVVLVLVVAVALWRSVEVAAVTGFAGGFLLDSMTYARLGMLSLLYVVAAVLISRRVHPDEDGVVLQPAPAPRRLVPWVVVAAVGVQLGDAALHRLLGGGMSTHYLLWGQVLPSVVETSLAALILAPLLRRMFAPRRTRVDVPGIAAT